MPTATVHGRRVADPNTSYACPRRRRRRGPARLLVVLAVSMGSTTACVARDASGAAPTDAVDADALPDLADAVHGAADDSPAGERDVSACDTPATSGGDTGSVTVVAADGPAWAFDAAADPTQPSGFFAHPYPADYRLTADGSPDLSGLPTPRRLDLVRSLARQAAERRGYPLTPMIYFRFDAPPALDAAQAGGDAQVQLIQVSGDCDARGTRVPLWVETLETDAYAPAHMLAITPRPGYLLAPDTRYVAVVLRGAGTTALGASAELADALSGRDTTVAATALAEAFAEARAFGVGSDVAAITSFTTGDPIADLAALGDRAVALHQTAITGLRWTGRENDRVCELAGLVELPQFQQGVAPFPTGGEFVFDDDGDLVAQRVERVPIAISVPRGPIAGGGLPVVAYLHGSGGDTRQALDRGPITEPDGEPTPGRGPAWVLAGRGIATVATSLPVNPERVPGADAQTFITGNLLAYRDNIRQGVIEQRLILRSLDTLRIPRAVLAACDPAVDWPEETVFDTSALGILGQSQGGQYANLVGATEARVRVVVPTGAGGYQSWLVLTQENSDLGRLIPVIIGASPSLTFMHPAMHLLQTAWEPVEALLGMRRLVAEPLAGHAPRSVYAPVAPGDSFYAVPIFDAASLAYDMPWAGEVVWASMGDALALVGVESPSPLPVRGNAAGGAATAAIVQHVPDPNADPHTIFSQLDAVMRQYACFFLTAADDGLPTLVADGPRDAPCDE